MKVQETAYSVLSTIQVDGTLHQHGEVFHNVQFLFVYAVGWSMMMTPSDHHLEHFALLSQAKHRVFVSLMEVGYLVHTTY